MNSNKKITKVQQRLQNAYKKLKHYRIHKLPFNLKVKEIKKHLLPPMLKQCNYCHKPFLTLRYHSKFCCYEHKIKSSSIEICEKRKKERNSFEIRKCKICGKEFKTLRIKPAKTCSTNCKNYLKRYSQYIHHCKTCGKEIPLFSKHDFCSEECINNYKPKKNYKLVKRTFSYKKTIYIHQLRFLVCPICNKNFITTNKKQIYCSFNCQTKADNKSILRTINCTWCGKEFFTWNNNQKFCSKNCAKNYSRAHKQFEVKICKVCGKTFETKQKDTIYCNGSCASKGYHRKNEIKYFLSNKWVEIKNRKLVSLRKELSWFEKNGIFYHNEEDLNYSTYICKQCGRKFKSKKFNKFCSKECENKSRIKYIKKNCIICGKEYECESSEKDWSEFCSDLCMNQYNNENFWNGKHICINCGKEFNCSNEHSFLFCSYHCHQQFYFKESLHKEKCKRCGKEFYTVHAKFCSFGCAGTFANNNSNNLSYLHGYFSKFGHHIRSGWEFNFTLILRYCNRKYIYEYKTFPLSNGTSYTPDFYDIKRNVYYEIKGYYRNFKKKFDLFRKEYPNIKIKVIDRPKYSIIYFYFLKKIKLMDNKLGGRKERFLTEEEINSYR